MGAMTRSLWLSLVAVVLIAWSSAWAAPRDPDVPLTNARNDWWMIGKDAKTTTSKCIGNPKTPVCAVETVEACLIRRDKKLCQIAAGPLEIFLPNDHIIPPTEKYRINKAMRLTKKNMPAWETPENSHGFRHVGDIEIEIETWRCDIKGACDHSESKFLATYLVRPTESQWSVAGRIECSGEPGWWGSACIGWPKTRR
jgi:hypothetical protein